MEQKIITICSSAAFYKDVLILRDQLQTTGFLVKIPSTAEKMEKKGNFNVNDYKTWYQNPHDYAKKTRLMDEHFQKVMEADAILVVNNEKHGIPGYIGGNVLMEMTLAYHYKKTIFVYNPVTEALSLQEEVLGMNPIFINGNLQTIRHYFTSA